VEDSFTLLPHYGSRINEVMRGGGRQGLLKQLKKGRVFLVYEFGDKPLSPVVRWKADDEDKNKGRWVVTLTNDYLFAKSQLEWIVRTVSPQHRSSRPSVSSSGGFITTRSPTKTFAGVNPVTVESAKVKTSPEDALINDPPLESVPIIPFEAAAQAGGVILDAVVGKVGKVLPTNKIKKEIESFGERAIAKYKKITEKWTHPDHNNRYHGNDDLLLDKHNTLEEVEVKATGNPDSKPYPAKNSAGK